MRKFKVAVCIVFLGMFFAGCRMTSGTFDVTGLFGKSRAEIEEILGEPNGPRPPEGRGAESVKRFREEHLKKNENELYYWEGEDGSYLPEPLTELYLDLKPDGKCRSVSGVTTGFQTPDELLGAIGLGDLEKTKSKKGGLGVSYRMPPYPYVQVNRRIQWEKTYKKFVVWGPSVEHEMFKDE